MRGAQYDLEVQTGTVFEPRRARYYSAAMDVSVLRAGNPFARLPEQWLVAIVEDARLGGRGTALYERRDALTGAPFGDGAHVVIADASYRGDDELGSLMSDLCEPKPSRIANPLLRERVQYFKESPEGVHEMSEIMEELYREGVEDGVRQGMQQGMQQTLLGSVRSLMETAHWTAEQALEALRVPEADRSRYLAML